MASNFDNGQLAPLVVGIANSPNYAKVIKPGAGAASGDDAIKFFWEQAAYNGTREYKGSEVTGASFYKDVWDGFSVYLPSGGFPQNKTDTIAQLFCAGGDYGVHSWGGMIEIVNQSLCITYRGNAAAAPVEVVASNIQWNRWNRIVVHAVTSHTGKGEIEVWLNGTDVNAPDYVAKNINFGFGDWDTATDSLEAGSEVSLHFGMYNWDTTNYTPGETRIDYVDSIHSLMDSGVSDSVGFATVNSLAVGSPLNVPEPTGAAIIVIAGTLGLGRRRR